MNAAMWVAIWVVWAGGYTATIVWLAEVQLLGRVENWARSRGWVAEKVFLAVLLTFLAALLFAITFGWAACLIRYVTWNLRGRP